MVFLVLCRFVYSCLVIVRTSFPRNISSAELERILLCPFKHYSYIKYLSALGRTALRTQAKVYLTVKETADSRGSM